MSKEGEGVSCEPSKKFESNRKPIQNLNTMISEKKIKILELFKGGGSISKYYRDRPDVEVISLDILKKYEPTHCIDIMEWDYKQYPTGYFKTIWASPECKVFSQLQTTWIARKWKNKEELEETRAANACYINKTIEIIKYFKPKWYFIENPKTSTIWNYIDDPIINSYILVDYCRFGTDYKKPTKILTNKILDNVLCNCKGKHKFRLGCQSTRPGGFCYEGQIGDTTTLLDRYAIPQLLLKYLLV